MQKNEIPAEKKTFSGSFWPKIAKNGQNWEKIGETAHFELIVQKNEDFFQKSGSIRLLRNTVPSFSCKDNKIDDRAQTTPSKLHIFLINSIFSYPEDFHLF